MIDISIIIPTYKRPDGIERALKSVLAMKQPDKAIEIIVADNDPMGSAKETVAFIAERSALPVHYVHVPEPGVSNARNGALAKASGRYLAFLDDDMEASETWLTGLLDTSVRYKSGLVFGAIEAVMPEPENPLTPYMSPYFSRQMDKEEGVISKPFGSGGSLIDQSLCVLPSPPFSVDRNETGGEDDFLFGQLIAQGIVIGWSPRALSYEHVPASRATPAYIWKRNIAFGQSPTQIAAEKGVRGIFGVILWMMMGAVQVVANGLHCAIMKLAGRPSYMESYARLAQGFGKIFWWDSFSPRLYGLAHVGNKED